MRFTIALVTILLAGNAAYAKNYNYDKPYGKYAAVEKNVKTKDDIVVWKKTCAMSKECMGVHKPKPLTRKPWNRNK